MKNKVFKTLLMSSFIFSPAILFSQKTQIEGTKFVHPIIEKWITEYSKVNPDFSISIKTDQENKENTLVLRIVSDPLSEENNEKDDIVYVGRYALLPVANTRNPLLEKAAKGLKKKDLIDLVFEKNVLDEDFDPDEKSKYTATVYTRSSESSTTITLAEYFNQSPERIKGKKIFGDDIYLLNAVQKDETGITFNTLNYVYDLNSRQLKSDISLLPLQLKSKQKEVLESLNIDKVIALLEESKIETIPVEKIGLQISEEYSSNREIANFIRWILDHGQEYNHEYGFLNLDRETLVSQKSELEKNNKEYLSYSKN
jgi:ABC-type phosphate transport system substrate-binding protein